MDNLTQDLQSPKSSKLTILAVIVLILLAIGLIYTSLNRSKEPLSDVQSSENVVAEETTDLTVEERAELEQKATEQQGVINALSAETSLEDRIDAHTDLASTYTRLGRYSDALKTLNKVSEQGNQSPVLWYSYANVYEAMRDTAKAIAAVTQARDLQPDNARYWIKFIELNRELSNEEKINLYEEALVKTEVNINIVTRYAEFLESIGNKEQAIAQWQQAQRVDPELSAQYQAQIDRLNSSAQ